MNNWTKKPLIEVADFILGKMLDKAKNKGSLMPYLANFNVQWGRFDLSHLNEMRFTEDELKKFSIKFGDILMCEGGEAGRCAYWKESNSSILFQKAIHRIRVFSEVDSAYLYYYFLDFGKKNGFEPYTTGSTIKHLPREQLAKIEISYPDIKQQKFISAILLKYDDLIQTNQQRIALLEEAAQRLYDEWFVKLRFPNHEQVPVVDGVPEGWAIKTLEQIAFIEMGQSPESKYYNSDGEGLPFHQGVSDFTHRFVENSVHTSSYTRLANAGDILCSVRAPVGRLNITLDNIAIGRGLSAFRSKENLQSLLFYQLGRIFRVEDSIGGGSIFNSVTKKELASQQILSPTSAIARQFNSIVENWDMQIKTLFQQNQKLAQARDALLPRLMSGKMDVSGLSLKEIA